MPELSKVPVQTVILSRDSGKKDAKGEPIFQRVTPPIGKPFAFTSEEVEDIMASNPMALRDPKDETELPQKIKQAADEAMKNAQAVSEAGGAAAGDAAQVAATSAKGRKPSKVAGGQVEGDAMIQEDDSDTL